MLTDSQKTKAQLIEELKSLQSRVAAFEQPERGANALQRSDILQALYATAPVGLCYLDTELRFLFINKWLADINGLSAEQHLGRRIGEVLPHVAAGVESQFRRVIETGEPILEGMVVAETPAHPEVKRHFQHNYLPVKSDDGTVTGISCVVQDVTERKRAEEALKEREQHFRLFSLSTGDCFWNWDMVAGTVERSSGFERIFGYLDQEILPDIEWWSERVHPEDKKRVWETFDAAVAGEQSTCKYEYRFRCRDDSYAVVDDHVCLIRDATGKVVRSLGAMHDITEHKRAENALRQRGLELSHMARLSTLGEMIAGVAHELGQPLFAIANFAAACSNLAREFDGKSGRQLEEWLGRIVKSVGQTNRVVQNLRQFTTRVQSERERLRIDEIIDDSVALLEFELRHRCVKVAVTPSPNAQGLVVCVDRVQIQQIMVNLLHNACQAMENTPELDRQIVIRLSQTPDAVEVAVEDRGTGITDDDAIHVFEAFHTTKKDGVGMGLAISRTIVENHMGRIWWAANADRGVTFRFTLPLWQETNSAN